MHELMVMLTLFSTITGTWLWRH